MLTRNGKTNVRLLIGVLITAIFACFSLYLSSASVSADMDAESKRTFVKPNYSEFPHDTKAHRLDCSKCHKFPSTNWKTVRKASDAFPDITDYPKHDSCVKCHMQQFFKGAKPLICSICHTDPGPRNSSRHPFPNPREVFDLSPKGKKAETDFVVSFPHDKHIEIVAVNTRPPSYLKTAFSPSSLTRRRSTEESCVVCHQTIQPQGDSDNEFVTTPPADLGDAFWLKKGTFKSAPTGHASCFTCHSADTGILPTPQSCAACHLLKPPQPPADFDKSRAVVMTGNVKVLMDVWNRRHSAGTFRHEFFAHVELDCSTCHNVTAMNTADPLNTKVKITSCTLCHATQSDDDGGALNLEMAERKSSAAFQCVKCHVAYGKLPIPDSHTKALAESTAK